LIYKIIIFQGSPNGQWNFWKIIVYPNEAIHDDCVVAFTGGYEKIAIDNQIKRVDVDRWYSI